MSDYNIAHSIVLLIFFPIVVVPNITQGPMDVARMLGDNVTFTCMATGIPLPDIMWSRDDMNSIEATGDFVMDNNTRVSILTLLNLQDGDFDNYTCTATNMFDSDSATALLGSE